MTTNNFDDIVRFILEHRRFALTMHARPDGDAIGSALGLALVLEGLGKSAQVYSADPIPRPYAGLPGVDRIKIAQRVEGDYDGLFVLECSNLERTHLEGLERFTVINIDHHPATGDFGSLNWVDPSTAAVGEMIYRLTDSLGVEISAEIATHLYVAILTDTGSFQFNNTRAETFEIAAELARCGADPSQIARQVYMNQPYARLRLLGRLLNTLELHPSRKIALLTLTRQLLKETGASANDVEGIVNYPLSVEGVLLAAFIRDEGDNRYRVSLRSKDDYDVAAVAREYGGGGHRNASGLSLEGPLDEVKKRLCGELLKLLES